MPNNSFAPMFNKSNRFSRRWSGTARNAVDPYITGYFFVHYSYLPEQLGKVVAHAGGPDGLSDNGDIASTLSSSCLSVTLPGGTVNKAEFIGLGGIKWSAPTNVDYDNICSMRFLEASSCPILGIMHGWVRMMRDYRAGVSTLDKSEWGNLNYQKANYASTMYYWTTKPDGRNVEFYSCLTGMFPLKDPMDQFGHDLSAIDKLEIDIDFNCDYVWRQPWTKSRCQDLANNFFDGAWGGIDGERVIEQYGSGDDGAEHMKYT